MDLNKAQLQAINTIEGPVMVIAGAGTGKTQVIAHRIANILRVSQTPPSSILCLTFTDNAAFNMRARLISLMGAVAYSVKIHTFHSFCNEVIQSRPEFFIFAKEAKVVDQLEQIEIFQQQIDLLPDGSVLKPWGDKYYYLKELSSKIQSLKRESISFDTLLSLIDAEKYFIDSTVEIFDKIKSLKVGKTLEAELMDLSLQLQKVPNLSEAILTKLTYLSLLYSQGGFNIGAAKSAAINYKNELLHLADSYIKNIPKQLELLNVYKGYQQSLKHRGRYDFDDMILFVLRAFNENPELLLEFQEKFQYILVDEFQDTNSAQNQLIELIGGYFDTPNIFVVGDDDQSIFRFQGASIENLQGFIHKYKIKPIVLTNNYRSHQLILDSASSVITHNQNRLGNLIKDIDKNLKSTSTFDSDPINLTVADSLLSENYLVATKIKELIASGVPASEIAVIYRNNSDVDELVEFLNQQKIPFYLPSEQNILDSKPIIHLINLLKFICEPTDSTLLYPVLSSEFININQVDLLHLLRHSRKQHLPLWQVISDKNELTKVIPVLSKQTIRRLYRFTIRIAKSIRRLEIYSLDRFFNFVIRRFRFLHYCLARKQVSVLNQLYTFYSELKRLAIENGYSLAQFLSRLDLYKENNVALSAAPITSEVSTAVQLMTAHRSKGLEFSHVFIIQAVDKKWGNSQDRSTIKLPPGIIKTELSLQLNDDNEDERRLFYVALTRAKSQIYISYSSKSYSGKDQIPSIFLSEIDPNLLQSIPAPDNTQTLSLQEMFSPKLNPIVSSVDIQDYLRNYLSNEYIFNVTHLNSYLRCPFCFYHNTILKVPQSKNKFSSFGTAIHAALSSAYKGEDNIILTFENVLKREYLTSSDYQESVSRGHQVLGEYLRHYQIDKTVKRVLEHDFKHSHIHLDNIPLTGKIDLINFVGEQTVEVVDFKTGNPDTKSKELSPDGDYFRQLVFYKLLAELDTSFKYRVEKGTIDFVEFSKLRKNFVRKEYVITETDIKNLTDQIKDIYENIINLDFNHIGDKCRDPLHLHYLLNNF